MLAGVATLTNSHQLSSSFDRALRVALQLVYSILYIIIAYLHILVLRSSKFTGDKEKKAASPSGMTTAAKLDHSCAMQVLQQCIGPRLSQEV